MTGIVNDLKGNGQVQSSNSLGNYAWLPAAESLQVSHVEWVDAAVRHSSAGRDGSQSVNGYRTAWQRMHSLTEWPRIALA